MKKRMNRKSFLTVLSLVFFICSVVGVFGYIVPVYSNAKTIGIGVGDRMGKIVGNVIGSYDGITTGLTKGNKDGKEEGLSAKDTRSEIANNFSEVGNLEVLESGVKLKNVNTLGDDYAALFLLKGVAVYSVNLKQAIINDLDANTVEILLPPVNIDIYIDENATEKLAEYQKHSFSGSAEDGFLEYMNTRTELDKSVKETMENYETLTEAAKESAIKQVGIIAKAATGNRKEVIVKFNEEGQKDE